MTSSIDFLPKFGIALSSASDFEIRSPTVCDAGALEAVVGADTELELLDQDAVLLTLHQRGAGGADTAERAIEMAGRTLTAAPRHDPHR